MYWEYRVLMITNEQKSTYFEVCEVHFDKNDVPYAWSENFSAETLDELKEDYEYMAKAFDHPVLKVVDNKIIQATE